MGTGIEWTDEVWNPTTGCSKVSRGCKNCYAETMTKRLTAMGQEKYQNGFEFTEHRKELMRPFDWNKPKLVFVNSMSDLFHEKISADFLARCFLMMNRINQHVYQVLTKRPHLALSMGADLNWSDNIWLGTSIEDERVLHRLETLKECQAQTKFLSLEPLLGPLKNLDLDGIDWVIVGGESGHGCRPIQADWVREIRDQCLEQDVPFFFKQWGGVYRKQKGRDLDGRTWDEFPKRVRRDQKGVVRHFPFPAPRGRKEAIKKWEAADRRAHRARIAQCEGSRR